MRGPKIDWAELGNSIVLAVLDTAHDMVAAGGTSSNQAGRRKDRNKKRGGQPREFQATMSAKNPQSSGKSRSGRQQTMFALLIPTATAAEADDIEQYVRSRGYGGRPVRQKLQQRPTNS